MDYDDFGQGNENIDAEMPRRRRQSENGEENLHASLFGTSMTCEEEDAIHRESIAQMIRDGTIPAESHESEADCEVLTEINVPVPQSGSNDYFFEIIRQCDEDIYEMATLVDENSAAGPAQLNEEANSIEVDSSTHRLSQEVSCENNVVEVQNVSAVRRSLSIQEDTHSLVNTTSRQDSVNVRAPPVNVTRSTPSNMTQQLPQEISCDYDVVDVQNVSAVRPSLNVQQQTHALVNTTSRQDTVNGRAPPVTVTRSEPSNRAASSSNVASSVLSKNSPVVQAMQAALNYEKSTASNQSSSKSV